MQKVSYDDVIADLLITVGYLVDSQHDRRFFPRVVRQPFISGIYRGRQLWPHGRGPDR